MSSFRKIDYSLRPAKHAERKMLLEIFRRLQPFGLLEDYVYVGFGSVWFADFALFHKALGVRDMVSFEKASGAKQRFEDNRPFRSIAVDFRRASEALPDLDWTRLQFIWLDYDSSLTDEILLDARSVASRARSGTLLTVSVQCVQAVEVAEARAEDDDPPAIERFRQKFGRDRVPGGVSEDDLDGWPFGSLVRQMIDSEIRSALAIRNAACESDLEFVPVCQIEYKDDANMTSLVGVFVSSYDRGTLGACGLDKLDFVSGADVPVRIDMPKLTVREIRRIERQLPLHEGVALELGSIPESEAKRFAAVYRYFPNFVVVET